MRNLLDVYMWCAGAINLAVQNERKIFSDSLWIPQTPTFLYCGNSNPDWRDDRLPMLTVGNARATFNWHPERDSIVVSMFAVRGDDETRKPSRFIINATYLHVLAAAVGLEVVILHYTHQQFTFAMRLPGGRTCQYIMITIDIGGQKTDFCDLPLSVIGMDDPTCELTMNFAEAEAHSQSNRRSFSYKTGNPKFSVADIMDSTSYLSNIDCRPYENENENEHPNHCNSIITPAERTRVIDLDMSMRPSAD